MEKIGKKRIGLFLGYIVIIIIFLNARTHFTANKRLENRMMNDFEAFGTALESLNEAITKILILDDYNFDKDREFINTNALINFRSSKYRAADIKKANSFYEYPFIYSDANTIIRNILADKTLSISQKEYLKALYDYNEELIKAYKEIWGVLYYEWDFDKRRELEKQIADIYIDYSENAEVLLNTSQYDFLKDYKGDFPEADFKKAKAFSEEVFSKLVENESLEYNNREDKYADKYIFRTYLERDFGVRSINIDTEYTVEYDKKTNEVVVQAVSFTVPVNIRHTERELDAMANDIVAKFDKNVWMYDKKIDYDDEDKIRSIAYSYIGKTDEVYDETKKIEVRLEVHGLISKFQIRYPYDEEIVLPTMSEEDILQRINKEGEIIEILIIRNVEGKMKYEVHFKYGSTIYGAVFDGEDGELNYFGRNIRDYN
ncbi:hypothetical protein SAMN05660297_03604 [Natronincola peptidivorans]|uniref:Uncharacterized protein n=1 Tax=Natronincola peptidivorans TaxID=426128 RepID=A0A1I0HDT2_9FIRM|nr:hypothetical protein [Natronincola peptidivorans]SET81847.1 hypothetical protein SAMN05660297_03604 [Natronincola peptidivorans]